MEFKLFDKTYHFPERFGYFLVPENNKKPKAVSYTIHNTETYEPYYIIWSEQYRLMRIPFGISLLHADGTSSIGISFDLDSHDGKNTRTPEEMEEYYKDVVSYLRFNYCSEVSPGGGIKIWVPFSEHIPIDDLMPFYIYMEEKFKDKKIEIYPKINNWIRLPGLYKDRNGHSEVLHSSTLPKGTLLSSFDMIEKFFNGDINDSKKLLSTITDMKLPAIKKEEESKSLVSIKNTGFVSGVDQYFNLIWEHFIKDAPPNTKIPFCCPFHDDKTPSAILDYHPDNINKKVFFCFSEHCGMRSSKKSHGRDAFDILYYGLHEHIDYTAKGVKRCYRYLEDKIINQMVFGDWIYPKGGKLIINYVRLSDTIYDYMRETGKNRPDVRRDENGILCFYRPENFTWKEVESVKEEDDVIYSIVRANLQELIGEVGIDYLDKEGLDKITSLVKKKVNSKEHVFVPNYDHSEYIPYKNGLLNIQKFLDDDPKCLELRL